MGVYFDFDDVDSFTVGAIGRPGQRTFLLQARKGRERVTVKCEKQQAAAIADYLRKVLNDLPPAEDRPMPASLELATPLDPAFVLGPVGLGYERATDRVLLQLDEIVPVDEEGEPDPEALEDRSRVRVLLTRGQVEAFCEQADQLVAAGRPPCRWCSLPIDPDGHICPRMN
jgi:uncharacterized repeat protein (TIGR03847 family)